MRLDNLRLRQRRTWKPSQESNSVADSSASVVPKVEATSSTPGSDPAAMRQPELQNSNGLSTTITVPAKIVSRSLPSIPPWAKGLDTDAVVQLDALIDENGNVAQTKPCPVRACCSVQRNKRWRCGYLSRRCRTGSRPRRTWCSRFSFRGRQVGSKTVAANIGNRAVILVRYFYPVSHGNRGRVDPNPT